MLKQLPRPSPLLSVLPRLPPAVITVCSGGAASRRTVSAGASHQPASPRFVPFSNWSVATLWNVRAVVKEARAVCWLVIGHGYITIQFTCSYKSSAGSYKTPGRGRANRNGASVNEQRSLYNRRGPNAAALGAGEYDRDTLARASPPP